MTGDVDGHTQYGKDAPADHPANAHRQQFGQIQFLFVQDRNGGFFQLFINDGNSLWRLNYFRNPVYQQLDTGSGGG
ncbi:hypothetical protein [Gimesia panareensis]|uniref:hypothetical protein n=1 Tax=Gimesia panareensis TaxID=2527978 RepID=UPI0018D9C890|nr:hypothetical protein [Gimesia panareensis]